MHSRAVRLERHIKGFRFDRQSCQKFPHRSTTQVSLKTDYKNQTTACYQDSASVDQEDGGRSKVPLMRPKGPWEREKDRAVKSKSRNHYHPIYQPNYASVKRRTDCLIVSFDKATGRDQANYSQQPSVQIQLSLNSSVRRPRECRVKGVDMGKVMPRERQKSSLPPWMQKGQGSRMFIATTNQKTLELNNYANSRLMSNNDRLHDLVKARLRLKKQAKNNDSSSSDLGLQLEQFESLAPLNLIKS